MQPSIEKQGRLTYAEAARRFALRDAPGGGLTWAAGPRSGKKAGWWEKDGYWRVEVDKHSYLVHRVVWLLATREWPPGDLDHKDLDKGNNKYDNLRSVSEAINSQNQKIAHSHNKSGLLGVTTRGPGKFRAQIAAHGRKYRLGQFATAEEAHQAYLAAKQQLHAEALHGN